jgi:general secretion pathway protein B
MSFILDALKKSELERQRQTIPGLMDAGPLERRRRFPLWAVALVVLLGVNLAVLLIVLLRSASSSTHTVSATAPAPASMPPAAVSGPTAPGPAAPGPAAPGSSVASAPPASASSAPASAEVPGTLGPRAAESPAGGAPPARAAKHFSPMDATPVYAPELPAENDAAAARAGDERANEATRSAALGRTEPAGVSPAHGARARDPVLTASEDKADEERLPTIGQIDLSGQPALPDLHLDVHVFATNPADRFVYIDMRKYREGAALADGLTLERIRRDGVVLNYHGLRFVLPRQQ